MIQNKFEDRISKFHQGIFGSRSHGRSTRGRCRLSTKQVLLSTTTLCLQRRSFSTKLRVVFDGSAKTTNSVTINDALMVGPVVQDDLFSIINRFPFYQIALSGDIEKMYRQIGLREEDRDFNRLWRDTASSIKHLRMTRIIYGVSCSAHVATRCLTEVANKTKSHVAKAIKHSFYDFPGGANSLEAIQLVNDLRQELLKNGFCLRKWSSNDQNLIKSISSELRAEKDNLKLFSDDCKV